MSLDLLQELRGGANDIQILRNFEAVRNQVTSEALVQEEVVVTGLGQQCGQGRVVVIPHESPR